MKLRLMKVCSMLLAVVMLFNLLPHQAIALGLETLDATDVVDVAPSANETVIDNEPATIVAEITENRTEFSKQYKLSNGLHMAVVYPEAVHYEKDGQWEDIDNTLKAVGSGSTGAYTNVAGEWNVVFPQQLNKSNRVSISKDGYTVSFGMAGEIRKADLSAVNGMSATASIADANADAVQTITQMQAAPAQIQELDHTLAKETAEHPEIVREKLQSRLMYNGVYDNTNIVYDLNSYQLKESIVLNHFDESVQGYRYTLETGLLVPVLNDDGSIDLLAPNSDEVILTMPAPYMIDDTGVISTDVAVSLVRAGTAYTLTYTMPMKWLADAERQWPVVLDPVIEAPYARLNILDQFVAEDYYKDNNWGTMYCGYHTNYGITRSFIQYVNLPSLTSADVIVNASLSLRRVAGNSAVTTVEAHKVNSTWQSKTITWDNKPGYNTSVEDYTFVSGNGRYSWEITNVARGWYTGENTGVMLKATDEIESAKSNNWKAFYTADYDKYDETTWPYLFITFRNSNGLEDYWNYTASSAGRAGTGYVNNYSGNLTWIHSDIGFSGNRMPVTISHVYNTNDSAQNSFGLGYGWRTNFNQTVSQETWHSGTSQEVTYYVWTDGDGTKHYFPNQVADGYKDEDGLELTLSISGSNKTITDKNGNKSHFDSQGRLYKLENNQATKSNITITYQSTSSKLITKITDGAGRVYNFTYSNGLLTRISYVGKGSTELAYVSFGYSGSKLATITDKDGEVSSFVYDSANFMTGATDIDGYKLQYSYSTGSPKRVVGIQEYDGTTAGGNLSIEYAHNQTTFKDHNENVEIMQFNDWGNVISVQDGQGRAQYSQYARNDYTDNTSKANQMQLSSKLQNTVINLFKDNSFELGTTWSALSTDVTSAVAADTAYYGTKSLKMTRATPGAASGVRYTSGVFVGTDTFTFSAYVKTDATASAYLSITTSNGEVFNSKVLQPGSDWTRLQVTCTASEYGNLYAQLMTTTAGTVYMDCVQFERAAIASRYNLVNNGDFRYGDHGWTRGSLFTSTEKCVTATSAGPGINGTVYNITGDPDACKHLYQTVNVSGGAGDTYVVAGWAIGDSAPLYNNSRQFSLVITFLNTDGTITRGFAKFNPDTDSSNGWQYAAGVAIADKTYSAIHVEAQYDNNVNNAYFDAIQLFKEEFGSSYTYDDKGNVKSVVDLQKQTTAYEYDTNSNLTKIIQAGVTQMTYTYDAYHNVKTATTATGEVYEFTYDTYGNNTEVKITSGGQTIRSTATYTTDGNRLASVKDALENTTTYNYNENTNVLEWVQYPNDTAETRTEYTYDEMYRLATAAADVDAGYTLTASYTYEDDLLTELETNSSTYHFTYGSFAQRTGVKVGNKTLAAYTYTDNQDRYLSTLTYGNGDSITYTYDRYGRIIKETYEDGTTVSYAYDNSGNLATVTDSETGIKTTYYYDLTDRLMKYVESSTNHSHSVEYTYDSKNNLKKQVETIDGVTYTTNYTYDNGNRITAIDCNGDNEHIVYDAFGRITSKATNSTLVTQYQYNANSGQVSEYTNSYGNTAKTYSYTYDDNGNITSVSDGTNVTTYAYDSANQLIRENNQAGGFTHVWTYDNAGNILSRTEYAYTTGELGEPTDTVTYTYGDADWGDLLTSYDGTQITYDGIGNPLNDGTWTYTWKHGRELSTMTDGTTTWTYSYDANGMRIGRSSSSGSYTYTYNGSQLVQMTAGSNTLYFTYGADGPISVTWNGTTYYYVTNLQGDVVAIVNSSGTEVARYTYDAWGNLIATYGCTAGTIGYLNPLRYRGYVYDQETGLYYVSSRYYDPEIGRWINADGVMSDVGGDIRGYNLFAYCMNNPVNMSDPTGNWPSWATKLVAAVAVVAVVAAVAAITVATAGAGTAAAVIAVGAAKGAAIGLVTGAAIGAGTAAVNHRVSTGTWEGADKAALEGAGDGALSGAITGAVTGAASGATKVAQAAKAWDSGTFKSGYQSMKYHYNKHVVSEGLTKGNNVLKYTQDAVSFANRNSSVLKYTYNYNYGNASWNLTYSTGQGGMFTSAGKILTFWYR